MIMIGYYEILECAWLNMHLAGFCFIWLVHCKYTWYYKSNCKLLSYEVRPEDHLRASFVITIQFLLCIIFFKGRMSVMLILKKLIQKKAWIRACWLENFYWKINFITYHKIIIKNNLFHTFRQYSKDRITI